jgi:hypothetical protein
MPVARQLPGTDERMQRLLLSVSAEDAAGTDLARMDSAVHVVLDGARAVAAAGYLTWPGGVAHLSVLTDPACRGRGAREAGRSGGHGGCAGARPAAAVACPGARIDPGRGQPRLRVLRQPAQLPPGRS